jgi:hypothetical protein
MNAYDHPERTVATRLPHPSSAGVGGGAGVERPRLERNGRNAPVGAFFDDAGVVPW